MTAAALVVFIARSALLHDAFSQIAATSGGRVGVYAEVVETHETAGLNETEHFPMQSVYKLPICMAVPRPKRLKGLLPPDTVVAHKTGTDGTRNGLTRATNDIGIITLPDGRHLEIAVFVKDSTADETTREATIARIAKAAFDAWRHE